MQNKNIEERVKDYLEIRKTAQELCWGFIAIVQKFRVKVVVRQVGNGKMEFQSVIPAWFVRQYREIKMIQNSTGAGLLNENDVVLINSECPVSLILDLFTRVYGEKILDVYGEKIHALLEQNKRLKITIA